MRKNHPERLPGFDYLGFHRYFLTFCTDGRRPLFTSADGVKIVLTQILRAAAELGFAVIVYRFMPDHLHLLVQGEREDSDGRLFIARAKQYSGFHYRRAFGERLWQRYPYERTLRHDEDTLVVARYILENPLRAGLVARVEDYPFIGSGVHTIAQICEAVQMVPSWRRSG